MQRTGSSLRACFGFAQAARKESGWHDLRSQTALRFSKRAACKGMVLFRAVPSLRSFLKSLAIRKKADSPDRLIEYVRTDSYCNTIALMISP